MVLDAPAGPPLALRSILRAVAAAVALSALGYVAYGVWAGLDEAAGALGRFAVSVYPVVLFTTLGNYGLRYVKWVYLLGRVGVRVPTGANLQLFLVGLLMTLSPGKAGEMVKPWLVREVTGAPLVRTVPVLVAERATDAAAILLLTAIGVGTYASDQAVVVAGLLVAVGGGLVVLASRTAGDALVALLSAVPGLRKVAPSVAGMLDALRSCLSPAALGATLAVSVVAWWLECLGTWLVLRGFDLDVGLGVSTFVYAAATSLGAATPGGLGVADAALAEGLVATADVPRGDALAAALLVRVATLWFGVVLGAIALLRVDRLVGSADARR
jgi:uncharacterized protein (TIRG00374 family)